MGLGSFVSSIGSSLGGLVKKIVPVAGPAAGGIFGGPVGAAIGAIGSSALGLASDWASNEIVGKPMADRAFDQSMYASAAAFNRSQEAYKNRYQMTMQDMLKAGLNPILAAGSGGFTVTGQPSMAAPTGFQSRHPVSDFGSSAQALEGLKKTEAEVKLTIDTAAKMRAEAGLMTKKEERIIDEIKQIKQNIETLKAKEKLSIEQKEVAIKQGRELAARLVHLQKMADVYKTPTGTGLIWIQEFFKSLGIPISAIGGFALGRGSVRGSLTPKIIKE